MTQQLPDVPASLPELAAGDVTILPVGTRLARLHDVSGPHPTGHDQLRGFGPLAGRGRFDHHPPGSARDHAPHHGILEVALDEPAGQARPGNGTVLDVILAEAVQAGRTLPVTDGLTLSIWRTSGELQLLDLRSRWSQRTRTGTHLSTAPHARTQPWARAIRAHYPQLHGILTIPATGGRALAAALNETSTPQLAGPIELSRPLRHPQLLPIIGHTAQQLGITIDLT